MPDSLLLHAQELLLPLKTVFKQASSVRAHGESVWCEAERNGISGFGEGCPRSYVTQEEVAGALEWIKSKIVEIRTECTEIDLLKKWMSENRSEIDQHPAAFCAVETAMLDLFARENGVSVESLLGQADPKAVYQYTGVLGDSGEEKFTALCQRYLSAGFTDFKVKVMGDLAKDQKKLEILQEQSLRHGLSNPRIRLDANNRWKGDTETAIRHLSQLNEPILGIEEPTTRKDYPSFSQISSALGLAIILDESLCSLNDLQQLDAASGEFIANIKISRLGGLIRSLEMIEELKTRAIRIIIGAHVGETSILTRAGMCAARAAGEQLLAQEGGYGLILLESEPAHPSLMFGARGQIDLSKPYRVKYPEGEIEIPLENWEKGWGLQCQSV